MLGKALTTAAAGNAAGGEATYVEDVFSTYLYDGNSGVHIIENGIALGDDPYGGSVDFNDNTDRMEANVAAPGTGDFTVEAWVKFKTLSSNQSIFSFGSFSPGIYYRSASNELAVYHSSAFYLSGFTPVVDTWYHIAFTRNGTDSRLFVDGVQQGSTTSYSTNISNTTFYMGYDGVDYFGGYLSNVRYVRGTALYTSDFTPSTTPLTDVLDTQLLTCKAPDPLKDNSSNNRTITLTNTPTAQGSGPFTSDTPGKGGLVWGKLRNVNSNHRLHDSERGPDNTLSSNSTDAEVAGNGIPSFNENGFVMDSGTNINLLYTGSTWTFAKQEKFFDVVTYTGNGGTQNISHNLGSVPGVIFIKRTSTASNDGWAVHHRFNYQLHGFLNSSGAFTGAQEETWFGNNLVSVAPTDAVFTVGSNQDVNYNGDTYVAYLFAHNDGDGIFGENGDQDIIKCGSYTADGSGNASVNLGFEPQWLMIKSSSATEEWAMIDNMRGLVVGGIDPTLYANLVNAEYAGVGGDRVNINATGFDTVTNRSRISSANESYIYIAIRRGPMKTPESGTEVFAQDYRHNATPAYTSNFPVDWAMQKRETGTDTRVATRMLGDKYLSANLTGAEQTLSTITWDYNDGMESHTSDQTDKWQWMFRRAPGFFDVVAYTGTGVARTVAHNLGVAPEMIITKPRDTQSVNGGWGVYHSGIGATASVQLNLTNASAVNSGSWNNTAPTASEFTVGTFQVVNTNGSPYIAYLFASVPGVSKVGSYTGNGTSQTIDCGFSTGARFVLIKRTDSTSNWNVFDTERGIVAGNDPRLELNTTDAEDTGDDGVDPDSSGFAVNYIATNDDDVNVSGGTYIFLAIA